MPLLGALGNASEYSFRGTYDDRPTLIPFQNLIDVDPGIQYITPIRAVKGINYKVPISITGDGEYCIVDTIFQNTFDNDRIAFDITTITFDSDFLASTSTYNDQPSYIKPNNSIGLRIFSVQPKILENSITILPRGSTEYSISLATNISILLRSENYTFITNNQIQIDSRIFQGFDVPIEYYGKLYTTTVTIGKEDYTWTVKTKSVESAKNLSFNNVTDVALSSEVISNFYKINGLNPSISYRGEIISNEGTFSVNNQTYTNTAIVQNNDIIQLKVNSSSSSSTEKSVIFRISLDGSDGTIGSANATWSVTTLDNVPSNFSFSSIDNAGLKTEIFSEKKIISGLSNNIDFDVAITETSGVPALLSVNDGPFVTSAKIRNGNTLQLKLTTTGQWLKSEVVRTTLANTSTFWSVTNRGIEAKFDPNASYLIYAFPFTLTEPEQFTDPTLQQLFYDKSPEVRLKGSLPAGLESTGTITTVPERSNPTFSLEQSNYYIGSYKLAKGTTTKRFEVNYLQINTNSTQALGISDFTIEMWIRASEFGFGGEVGMSIFYPSFIDNRNPNDYFFQLFLKGDNWRGVPRGLLLGYPSSSGVQTICETSVPIFINNAWYHIALTRSGTTFRIWINGSDYAAGSANLNLTSTRYNFMIPNSQRLISGNFYVQDLRLYRGIAKYKTYFDPITSVSSIMEEYSP